MRQSHKSLQGFFGVKKILTLVVAVFLVVGVACGSDDGSENSGDGTGRASGPKSVVRFAFAPDETMSYLIDTGVVAEMEEEWGVRLEMTSSWDEFAFFAGGHGDIVSTGTAEVPLLEQETGIKTVSFGKYATSKQTLMVRADSPYQTIEDLVGKTIASGGATGGTLLWSIAAKENYGLDLNFGGGDFDLILNDHATNPDLLARGDVEACVCPIQLSIKYLASGEFRYLYDSVASEYYGEYIFEGHEGHVLENVFVANEEWYNEHPYEVAFFLALWEKGIQLWHENTAELVATYPQHFAVTTDEEIAWMTEWAQEHPFIVDSVYLEEEFIEVESQFYPLMRETGFMNEDAEEPTWDFVTPEDVAEQHEKS